MTTLDTSSWTPVGRTSNGTYYTIEPRVLGMIADAGSSDDAATARENVDFQNRYHRENGGGVSLVFVDWTKSQDRSARQVYVRETDYSVWYGTAMVGGTMLSRAMAALITGFNSPKYPFKYFASVDDALPWARAIIAEARSK